MAYTACTALLSTFFFFCNSHLVFGPNLSVNTQVLKYSGKCPQREASPLKAGITSVFMLTSLQNFTSSPMAACALYALAEPSTRKLTKQREVPKAVLITFSKSSNGTIGF